MRRSGKVRENSPQKVREGQGILSGHVSGNPARVFEPQSGRGLGLIKVGQSLRIRPQGPEFIKSHMQPSDLAH